MDQNAIIVAGSLAASTVIISVAVIGASFGDAKVTTQAIESIARQPEAKDSIMTAMLISCGLIESIPIIAAVIALVLVFANPFIK